MKPACWLSWMLLSGACWLTLGQPVWAQNNPSQPTNPLPQTRQPIQVGSLQAVGVPEGYIESLKLELGKGRIGDYAADGMSLAIQGVDVPTGSMKGLTLNVNGGMFEMIPVDEFRLQSGAFAFDPYEFLNNRRIIVTKPVEANVSLRISEASLQKFIAHPETLSRLEAAIAKQTGGMKLITLSNPSLSLLGKDNIRIGMLVTAAGAIAAPVEMAGRLALNSNGSMVVQNLAVSSGGAPLPVDLASSVQDRLNKLMDFQKLGKDTFSIKANTLSLKGKTLFLEGKTQMTKLEFNLKKNAS